MRARAMLPRRAFWRSLALAAVGALSATADADILVSRDGGRASTTMVQPGRPVRAR